MGWRKNIGWLSIGLLFFSGCTSMTLDAGFDDIKATVERRSALQISWNNGTELDKEASEKLHSLLKRKLTADDAVQIALLNNRDLQAVYADLGVARGSGAGRSFRQSDLRCRGYVSGFRRRPA